MQKVIIRPDPSVYAAPDKVMDLWRHAGDTLAGT